MGLFTGIIYRNYKEMKFRSYDVIDYLVQQKYYSRSSRGAGRAKREWGDGYAPPHSRGVTALE